MIYGFILFNSTSSVYCITYFIVYFLSGVFSLPLTLLRNLTNLVTEPVSNISMYDAVLKQKCTRAKDGKGQKEQNAAHVFLNAPLK